MEVVFKEELAYDWCRMNDKGSFFNNPSNRFWTKDKVLGAMKIIENFVDKETLMKCWKKYKKHTHTYRKIILNP